MRNRDDVERFKDYTSTRKVDTVVFEDTPDHYNTICGTCNVACHPDCGIDEVKVKGDKRFLECAAFSGSEHCKVCGGEKRCDHSTHYHARQMPIKKSETLEEVLEDVKRDYDQANTDLSTNQLEIDKLKDSKILIEDSISDHSKCILDSCRGIKDICKGFNFAEELHILVQQLKASKQLLTEQVAKEAADRFIKSIEGIVDSLNNEKIDVSGDLKIKEGSYKIIECTKVLSVTPDSSPRGSDPLQRREELATNPNRTRDVDRPAGRLTGGGGGGGDTRDMQLYSSGNSGIKCRKCQTRHNLFDDCPNSILNGDKNGNDNDNGPRVQPIRRCSMCSQNHAPDLVCSKISAPTGNINLENRRENFSSSVSEPTTNITSVFSQPHQITTATKAESSGNRGEKTAPKIDQESSATAMMANNSLSKQSQQKGSDLVVLVDEGKEYDDLIRDFGAETFADLPNLQEIMSYVSPWLKSGNLKELKDEMAKDLKLPGPKAGRLLGRLDDIFTRMQKK